MNKTNEIEDAELNLWIQRQIEQEQQDREDLLLFEQMRKEEEATVRIESLPLPKTKKLTRRSYNRLVKKVIMKH